ncbi:MAG: hypothetical protein ACPL6D_14285 [Thermodesulfobacteriota bacterium]
MAGNLTKRRACQGGASLDSLPGCLLMIDQGRESDVPVMLAYRLLFCQTVITI